MANRRPTRVRGAFHGAFGSPSRVGREGTWLVFLSAADLFTTYTLLWRGGRFYESNPLAQWFFRQWNIAGMTAYKFALVGLILVLGEVIERHRPGWGRAVVAFGGVAAALAATHGLRLLLAHEG